MNAQSAQPIAGDVVDLLQTRKLWVLRGMVSAYFGCSERTAREFMDRLRLAGHLPAGKAGRGGAGAADITPGACAAVVLTVALGSLEAAQTMASAALRAGALFERVRSDFPFQPALTEITSITRTTGEQGAVTNLAATQAAALATDPFVTTGLYGALTELLTPAEDGHPSHLQDRFERLTLTALHTGLSARVTMRHPQIPGASINYFFGAPVDQPRRTSALTGSPLRVQIDCTLDAAWLAFLALTISWKLPTAQEALTSERLLDWCFIGHVARALATRPNTIDVFGAFHKYLMGHVENLGRTEDEKSRFALGVLRHVIRQAVSREMDPAAFLYDCAKNEVMPELEQLMAQQSPPEMQEGA